MSPRTTVIFNVDPWAAVTADTLSLTAWQIGMYGFMAFAYFSLGHVLDGKLATDTPEFWFMIQIVMLCGFVTSYPVNWWLMNRCEREM